MRPSGGRTGGDRAGPKSVFPRQCFGRQPLYRPAGQKDRGDISMSLKPGRELKISQYVALYTENLHLDELVKLPLDKLIEMEQESIAKEEAIYTKVENEVKEWAEQAKETIRARKAQEYRQIYPANHTSNYWVEDKHGNHEISNMVYKMRYRIYEGTDYSSNIKPRPVYWKLSWYVTFNIPPNPDYSGNGRQIAGQQGKKFKDRAEMEKYLQGRIKAYSHLFREISPSIPEDARKRFCVNGVLLPGYTVVAPIPPPPNMDELLSLLEDGDIDALLQPEEPVPPPDLLSRRQTPKKAKPHKRRNPVPTR